jgi:hypothetical protein
MYQGIRFETEAPLAVRYRDELVDCAYRVDFFGEPWLLVNLQSVQRLSSLHKARIWPASGCRTVIWICWSISITLHSRMGPRAWSIGCEFFRVLCVQPHVPIPDENSAMLLITDVSGAFPVKGIVAGRSAGAVWGGCINGMCGGPESRRAVQGTWPSRPSTRHTGAPSRGRRSHSRQTRSMPTSGRCCRS